MGNLRLVSSVFDTFINGSETEDTDDLVQYWWDLKLSMHLSEFVEDLDVGGSKFYS